jgi:transposase
MTAPLLEPSKTVPVLAREVFETHGREYTRIQEQLQEVEDRLMAWHRANECSRRLATIPRVGPIGATMLVMKTPTPEAFRSARHFAAWLGLTPKDYSTAGRVRLGVITRAGEEALRSVLVAGATAVIRHAQGSQLRVSP